MAGSLLAVSIPGLTKHRATALAATALGASLAILFSYQVVLGVGLEPLALAWAGRPWLKLGLVCLILVVPFILCASHIGLILAWAERPNRAYASNMTGSGAGCLAAALSLIYLLPHQALYAAAGLTMLGFIIQVSTCPRKTLFPLILIAIAAGSFIFIFPTRLHYEPFKDRSAALAARGSGIEKQETGLHGVVEVIGGPAFHFAPGFSLSCSAPLPPQRGLFVDGNLIGPVTKADPAETAPVFVRCLLTRLPVEILKPRRILILNPGGGLNILTALDSSAIKIVGVEENPQIYKMMAGHMANFNGNIYGRPRVEIIQADPFTFLRRTKERFDLIVLGHGTRWESGSASGMGITRLLTVEGLRMMAGLLTPRGGLAISGPLMHPPRASIRLLATAHQTLRELGMDAKTRLTLARDWNMILLLIKPGGFEPDEKKHLALEAARQGFDLPYYPGEDTTSLSHFHELPGKPLVKAAEMIMGGRSQELFSRSHFNLHPATRERPYFFNFFRVKTLDLILDSKDSRLLSVTEWGLLFTWGGVLATLLLAGSGIFLPLLRLGPPHRGLIFFSLIGLGYMIAEITLLEETIYHLGNPAQAIPLVVGIFLMLSGVGSLMWGQRAPKLFTLAAAVILPLALLVLRYLPGESIMVALVLAPAALFMGAPFAGGLTHLIGPNPSVRAWAYGVNGFFSVTGSLIAALVCLQLGHSIAILSAGGCYLLAGLVSKGKKP
ncbi:MAG: hypothetical protein JRG97_14595 [Deltaproteobacteria bacterium]|nr:hypothetical protein [Deltaproteobacteria bacterium]